MKIEPCLSKETEDRWSRAAPAYIELQRENPLYNQLLQPKLLEMIGSRSFRCAVDAGCGTGELSHQLWMAGATVQAFDPTKEFIDVAKKNYAGPNFCVSGFEIQYELDFDFAICINVLNNCSSLEPARKFFERHCSKCGSNILISIKHPLRTAAKAKGKDGYRSEFQYESTFLGNEYPILGWHRHLGEIVSPFLNSGFLLSEMSEIFASNGDEALIEKFGRGPFFLVMNFKIA
jgi:SAM-dependent methyltransferase